MRKNKILNSGPHPAVTVLVGLSATAFLVFPTNSFQNLTQTNDLALTSNQSLLFFILAATTLFALVFKPTTTTTPCLISIPLSTGKRLALSSMGVVLIGMVVWDARLPLHWEEHYHFITVLNKPWHSFNPFANHTHHVGANFLAWLSTSNLGLSHWTLRLPSLILGSAFILYLLSRVQRQYGGFVLLLIIAHFLCNQKVIWYLHSMRGYILLMLISAYFLFEASTPNKPKYPLIAFFLAVTLCITHGFGVVFLSTLLTSLGIWTWVNRKSLDVGTKKNAWGLSKILLLTTPLWAALAIFQSRSMNSIGDFFHADPLPWSVPFARLFGLPDELSLRFLTCTLFAILLLRSRQGYQLRKDVIGIFLILTAILIFTLGVVLNIRQLEGRFFLPFLLPLLIWVGQGVNEIQGRYKRWLALTLIFISFILLPLRGKGAIQAYLTDSISEFYTFVTQVKEHTQLNEGSCFQITGQPDQVYLAKEFHFRSNPNAKNCTAKYRIHFPHQDEPSLHLQDAGEKVLSDSTGRTLYRKSS